MTEMQKFFVGVGCFCFMLFVLAMGVNAMVDVGAYLFAGMCR